MSMQKSNMYKIFVVLGTMHYFVYLTTARCTHAPDADKMKERLRNEAFRDYLLGRWTFKSIKEYRQNTAPDIPKNLFDIKSNQTRISGEPNCRKNRHVSSGSDISSKATCPWHMVLDVDNQRQPQFITKAKCSCKRCFTVDRTGKTRDRCTEVNSYIPVVKWRCPHDYPETTTTTYFEYFIDVETVPVGCTCRRPVKH